ncbi:HindVP family restriction endonuclease [Ferruginibacter lapsinanis]|uniref:HindVP family restriction endonuclease n=1 Tax=Ferruginibacter lapsinanis TaxID=563172 RepID=UPI001E548870|nr:HindVP family restriction endonuclease [Ferruginibacter lapsinanis]UEG50314.1 HindVP family restriction endonuclease [Ferruginibacter lapsinanis]
MEQNPGLFGITYSNRDFTQSDTWGKNQFNSSFPAALTNYLSSRKFENIYLILDKELQVQHTKISTNALFGISPTSDDLFFSFESPYTPYQQLVIGHLPRVDLVTQQRSNGQVLRPLEIKLTALPDNSTCDLKDDYFSSEIVIRPDTIVYLACSIASNFKDNYGDLKKLIGTDFDIIEDWSDGTKVWPHIHKMISAIDRIILSMLEQQEPILMQPIWKTEGKSPQLAENCLDVFVWSNFAFAQLFVDVARGELNEVTRITRQIRTIIWLFKMLYDFGNDGQFNHSKIIDELSYNTKNDKAFSVSGRITHRFLTCDELTNPRISKSEIKNIILGGGQLLLSPERRFDAIIYNSPELFN